ncbi:hypothetical protein KO486_12755 [Octadecabacter sp. B2R22]|uniref:DnaA N-terminal domain-containing protein n=1 Tax=Octadecabacter sp. B2R22 TaxID=2841570 RepID=UPI001C07F939|nr:DnaA N-terminal domain-containing protein [Octadecabacter sp. B2R22]MBU2994079.1 hypothetical protein [Octadecabacter sp. B2R22]
MEITNDRQSRLGQGGLAADYKFAGPGSASLKYDVLTALLALAAQNNGTQGRLALRLSLVITARFNWKSGFFSVGVKELARMWGVTERTAKREIGLMRSINWISVQKAATRGRVTQHRIQFADILRDTIGHWDAVGPDFAARMAGAPEPSDEIQSNVVPLHTGTDTVPAQDGTIWPAIASEMKAQDPAVYAAWLSALAYVDRDGDHLVLAAPSSFSASYIETHLHTRLLSAAIAQDRSIKGIRLISMD